MYYWNGETRGIGFTDFSDNGGFGLGCIDARDGKWVDVGTYPYRRERWRRRQPRSRPSSAAMGSAERAA